MKAASNARAYVIVSFNCRDALREGLRSLLRADPGAPVVVIDNASTDGTVDMLQLEFPQVEVIANRENRGFAAACNQGIAATNSECVVLLNPDTLVDAPAIQRLYEIFRSDVSIGACGPRIHNRDGTLQPSCRSFPTLAVMLPDELGLARLFPRSRLFSRYRMCGWQHDATREVEQLMGACLFLRRSALLQVGGLDERFFLYFEEVDLCRRLWQSGWRCVFVHDAGIVHVGGQSSGTARSLSLQHRYRSLFTYYRKHHPGWQLPLLKFAVWLGALLRALSGRRHYRSLARRTWQL